MKTTFFVEQKNPLNQRVATLYPEISQENGGLLTGTFGTQIKGRPIAVAYDTMARRRELVAIDVEDFTFMENGSGRVIIRRSKTDQVGEGSLAYLSPDTVEYLIDRAREDRAEASG